MQRVKKDEIPAETIENQEGSETQLDEFESLSYVDQVQDFIKRNDLLEIEAVYYLYKYDSNTGNAKAFIHKYNAVEPPDEDTIGRTFGSGRYLVILAIPRCEKAPKGYMRSYQIKIHAYYDTLRQAPAAPAAPAIIQQSGNNFADAFDMIAKIVAIITPLLQKAQSPAIPDMSTMLFKTYETTNEVLQKSMIENVKGLGQLQRKMMQLENGEMNVETEVDEEETSLIESLKPLIIEWLPKLIGDSPQSKAVQTMVKTAPQFKQIVNNKREFKTLVAYLDQNQGKEVTDKLLSSLKLKRV